MSFDHADVEGFVFLVSSVPSDSHIHSASLHQGSLKSERRDLVEKSHLGLNVPESLILCFVSDCESLYLFHPL